MCGRIEEHAVDIKKSLDRSVKGLLELLSTSLTAERIASQCYDEAKSFPISQIICIKTIF